MISIPPVPLYHTANVINVAQKVMEEDGSIRLGMFIYALVHGPKFKYGSLLQEYREPFVTLTHEELRGVYELVLAYLDEAFPGMSCAIEAWHCGVGYVAEPGDSPEGRFAQRFGDLVAGRHPDAKTSTRGTLLPGTTWYRSDLNGDVM